MRKIKHVWKQITDLENITTAIMRASDKKKHRKAVQRILENIDFYALKIQGMLINQTYIPSPYISATITDGRKERLIHKPQFYPDQIIHWALVLPLQEMWGKSLYPFSCGSIPGRGLHMGAVAVKRWLKNDKKNTKYCYKIDISKYYPSIDQDILINQFRKQIHEPEVLWLIESIIRSHDKGLPIGNFTSQWFANLYLKNFDWWVKQDLKVPYYIRYIDDIVVFHRNKKELHKIRKQIEIKLKDDYHVKIKNNWQVFRTDSRGVDFLGFRFYHYKTIIRKSTCHRMARRIKGVSKKPDISLTDASAVMSYMGITSHCNSKNFINRYVVPFVSIKKLKEIHRENSKSFPTPKKQSYDYTSKRLCNYNAI